MDRQTRSGTAAPVSRSPSSKTISPAQAVDDAIGSRRSVRAFLPHPVAAELVAELLDIAARAPSGTNMQPWRAFALAGETKERLSRDIVDTFLAEPPGQRPHHDFYPQPFYEPYLSRRREVGKALYTLIGIPRGDVDAMRRQHARNFMFFDAPVGLIFTIDSRLKKGSWLDYGMFLQNIMVAARARGLDTCPQAAFSVWRDVIARHLPLQETDEVICGMSLGYADPDAPENRLWTARERADAFTEFHGFPPSSPAER